MKFLNENKFRSQTLALLSLLAGLGLWGCSSSSNNSNNNNASATIAGASIYMIPTSGGILSECSGRSFQTAAGVFSAQAETFLSNGVNGSYPTVNGSTATGSFNYSWVRLRVTALPTDFNTSTGSIAFFGYNIDSSGNPIGMTNIPFTLESYGGSNTFTPLNSSVINGSMPVNGQNLQSVDFVLQLPSTSLNVINVALYSNPNTSPIHNLNILVPGYYANPNTYQSYNGHTAPETQFHPLFTEIGNGYSDSQYSSQMQQYCF